MNEVNPLLLERFLLGELPPEQAEALRVRLAEDPQLAARLQTLRDEDEAIRAALPATKVGPGIARRLHLRRVQDEVAAGRRQRKTWLGGLALLATAAAALLVLPSALRESAAPFEPPGAGEVRPKGEEGPLLIHRAGRQGAEVLRSGQPVQKGDRLQMALRAGEATHGVLLSWDGAGVVTRHFPAEGGTTHLPPGEMTLPRSYVLDDAPSFERFVFLRSAEPLDVPKLEAAAKRLAASAQAASAPLIAPAEVEQFSVLLPKEGS